MVWNYLSTPKLQRLHRWSLGLDKGFRPTHCNGCNNLSMLGLKLIYVSIKGHWWSIFLEYSTEKIHLVCHNWSWLNVLLQNTSYFALRGHLLWRKWSAMIIVYHKSEMTQVLVIRVLPSSPTACRDLMGTPNFWHQIVHSAVDFSYKWRGFHRTSYGLAEQGDSGLW